MKIIVGLGNPGDEYKKTRHNTGFMVVDRLAEKYNIEVKKEKSKALFGTGEINGEKVMIVKPQTFMNLSGEAVRGIMDFYKESIENILIIFDDIDLELGNIRIKERGSAGTHNGMKSIVQNLGTVDFKRVKVGIGKPKPNIDLVNHVLGKFSDEEFKILSTSIDKAVNAAEIIVSGNVSKAMNLYNWGEIWLV